MKSAGARCATLAVVGAGLWALVPKPPHETQWEALKGYAYFTGHLLGWLPRPRPAQRSTSAGGLPRGAPGARPSNGSIPEVNGWVDEATFKSKYIYKGPVVFRGAATKRNGFNLECLTGTGRPLPEEIDRQMGDRKFRMFTDTYNDASATFMTLRQYQQLADTAEANHSSSVPYIRAIPQAALGECEPVPEKMLEQYHGMFSSAAMLPQGAKALFFYSANKGSTTKMHFDVGDSFFTQIHGRKKWRFVDPAYTNTLQAYAETNNLFYASGYDVHLEAVPAEVDIREVVLHPTDIVYFPAFTFHAVENLDTLTVGVDQPCMDFGGAIARHWLPALASFLNPYMIIKVFKQILLTGTVNGHEVYFDDQAFSAEKQDGTKVLNAAGA